MKTYPNARDCEHGSQRGKCVECDLATSERECERLRQELDFKRVELLRVRRSIVKRKARTAEMWKRATSLKREQMRAVVKQREEARRESTTWKERAELVLKEMVERQCHELREVRDALADILANDCYHPENLPEGDERCQRANALLKRGES